jgi:glycosyltransferase involved in cell wall biosynthesis
MKAFIDAHLFDKGGQGTKTYLKGLYSELVKRDLDTQWFFAAKKTDNVREEIGSHPNAKFLNYKSSNKYLRLSIDIPSKIRTNKIDIAHFQYISPIIKNCKQVVTIHDLLFLEFPLLFPIPYKLANNFLFKRSALKADLVTTVSNYSKASLINHYGIDKDKIVVTPNGVLDLYWENSTELVDIGKKFGAKCFILYVSRFEPRKNQDGLLNAYCRLKLWEKGIQLVFIGGAGIYAPEFQKLYQSLPQHIREFVLIINEVTFDDLRSFYRSCLLFIYPSYAEGFGIPPLEAAVCGANTLCSNSTAMKEFDFLGERMFNPYDSDELSDKIKHFLYNPPSENEKKTVREIIKSKYSWEASAKILWNRLGSV